jgi:hypothetical protein
VVFSEGGRWGVVDTSSHPTVSLIGVTTKSQNTQKLEQWRFVKKWLLNMTLYMYGRTILPHMTCHDLLNTLTTHVYFLFSS